MAIGMLKLRNGSKGKGVAHFNYIMREDKYKPHAEKLEKLEAVGHGNMPEWASENPKMFWQEADKHERENGRVYKEHIIALPRELNEAQRLELVKDWIKNEIGDKHPYSYAIHTPQGMDGKEQPHVHFMFSQRTHDDIERSPDQFFKRYNNKYPERGGAKKANETLTKTQSKEKTKEQRMRLGEHINKHLERAGSKSRVDMRNWKEKGLDQKPLNISYTQMQDPAVKQAFKAKYEAQAELKEAVKERTKVIGIGQTGRAIKDLEIRIEQEQPQKSRKGQWVRHRQKDKEAQQKAELVKSQLEKMGEVKGIAPHKLYEKMATATDDKLQEFKQTHIERAKQLEQKAQHEILTDKELMDYSISKKYVNTIEQIQHERTAPAVTTPPPSEKMKGTPVPANIDPLFAKIKEMDKEQRQRMKENFIKALQADPKAFTGEKRQVLQELQSEGKKFIGTLERVENHERLSERLEQMQQDREQGKKYDPNKGR